MDLVSMSLAASAAPAVDLATSVAALGSFEQTIADLTDKYGPVVGWAIKIGIALVVLVVGYFIAKILSGIIAGAINRIPFIADANEKSGPSTPKIGSSIGQALFWLLMLAVVAAALSVVGLGQVTEPVQNMWNEILGFLPQLLGALAILVFGLIFATIARRAVHSVLVAAQLDNLVARSGVSQETGAGSLSVALSWVVYALIAIFVISAAVGALGIDAISVPVLAMLTEITDALPNVVIFGLILAISYFVARLASTLVEQILPQFGIDNYVSKLGLMEAKEESGLTATKAISTVVGIAIMLFGLVEATQVLGFEILSDFVEIIIEQGGQILFGVLIILAGIIVANAVGKILDAAGSGASDMAAKAVKYAILILAVILGISRMGLDPQGGFFVLDVARYFVLAAAVAVGVGGAIAFGLGGREWAAEQLRKWRS